MSFSNEINAIFNFRLRFSRCSFWDFGKRAKTKIDSMYIGIELKVVGFSASAYFQLESEARISKNFPRTDTVGWNNFWRRTYFYFNDKTAFLTTNSLGFLTFNCFFIIISNFYIVCMNICLQFRTQCFQSFLWLIFQYLNLCKKV